MINYIVVNALKFLNMAVELSFGRVYSYFVVDVFFARCFSSYCLSKL